MTSTARNPRTALAAAMFILLVACSAATVISYINTALQIAEQAAALSGVVPPQYVGYVSAALDGIACASTEAATADTAVAKSAKITACFANVAAPILPPGTAQNVVTIIAKLSGAIQRILTGLPAPAAVSVTSAAATQPSVVSDSDRKQLLDMAERAKEAKVRLLGAHK